MEWREGAPLLFSRIYAHGCAPN